MANQTKEQAMLWSAALKAIGRALRHEFERQQQEMPDRIRQLLAQLEKHKPEEEKH
jgi:hypothetical protein